MIIFWIRIVQNICNDSQQVARNIDVTIIVKVNRGLKISLIVLIINSLRVMYIVVIHGIRIDRRGIRIFLN